MAEWQNAHLPLRKSQDKMGMLCQGFKGVWHFGQCEGTNTTLSSFGSRNITTFKNEPITAPKIKAIVISTILAPQIFALSF